MTRRTLSVVLALVLMGAGVLVAIAAAPASAYNGAPWFSPLLTNYTQNFPDPHIVKDGSTYYAYGTTTGGSMLPVMSSTDLVTWKPRPKHTLADVTSTCPNGLDPSNSNDTFLNDGLLCPPSWGLNVGGDHIKRGIIAPGVFQVSPGQWRAYYAVLMSYGSPDTYCISVASASSPLGPFRDNSAGPLKCDLDEVGGSIDPVPFLDDPDGDGIGTPFLVWQKKGVPDGLGRTPRPTRIFSQQLSADGRSLQPGSGENFLLETGEPNNPHTWEGTVIENPTVVRYQGRLLIGWSANRWQSADYRFGMGRCDSIRGPCTRGAGGVPVLDNTGSQWSKAGGNLFIDTSNHLQTSYHWWNPPYTDYPSNPNCDGGGQCISQGQRRLGTIRLSGFLDVRPSAGFFNEIAWLVDVGVTSGYGDSTFRPGNSISRQEFAVMLSRYAGSPNGTGACAGSTDPFPDVSVSSSFCREIQWLASTGVTAGGADGTFNPKGAITRQALAAFLYRYDHGAAVGACPGVSPFPDVDSASIFCASIQWMSGAGITGGYPDGGFHPAEPVSRQGFAAFLNRYDAS